MESILHTFGIDWRLLLVNAVNFALLMAGLTYFLYKPILRMLEERRTHMAQGVAAAEEAKARLAQIEAERGERMREAAKEADELLAAGRAAGAAREREIVEAGERRAEAVVAEAAAAAKELKERALRESKEEVAKLIVLGMQKVK